MKANQPNLLHSLEAIVATQRPIAVHDSDDRARNRREDRHVYVYPTGSALKGTEWEPFVAAMVCVHRQTLMRSPATGLWTSREEASFYISSIMLPVETFAQAIRSHWGIENKNHWVKDVTMVEDASRIRINPGIMARLRSQVLNILRANGVTNIAAALWNGAISADYALSHHGLY